MLSATGGCILNFPQDFNSKETQLISTLQCLRNDPIHRSIKKDSRHVRRRVKEELHDLNLQYVKEMFIVGGKTVLPHLRARQSASAALGRRKADKLI
jgi:hypothetical protein